MSYVAIGNNELGEKLGALLDCHKCGKRHRVQHSGQSKRYNTDGTISEGPSGLMQFYKCKGNTYLCGIEGQAIKRWQA